MYLFQSSIVEMPSASNYAAQVKLHRAELLILFEVLFSALSLYCMQYAKQFVRFSLWRSCGWESTLPLVSPFALVKVDFSCLFKKEKQMTRRYIISFFPNIKKRYIYSNLCYRLTECFRRPEKRNSVESEKQ